MVLWIVLALLTGAAVLAVLWPLSRTDGPDGEPRGDDVRFYREQLAEIARERDRGALGAPEAEAATIEASRRLLRASASVPGIVDTTAEPALRRRRAASALALSVIPIVGLAFYGGYGSPHLSSQPTEARLRPAAEPAGDMASALAAIEGHLAKNADDLRGWDVLAPIYLRSARYADAARAFGHALRLGGDTRERLLGQGEALVGTQDGIVGDAARDVFRRALALDASLPAARYYLALAAEQAGDEGAARDAYGALLADAPPEASWVPLVQGRLAGLGGQGATPAPPLNPDALPPEIAAMVSGLDARLKAGGGSETEWSRLVRSYVVLGRRDEASDRLARARAMLAADAPALSRLDTLATELGLGSEVARR